MKKWLGTGKRYNCSYGLFKFKAELINERYGKKNYKITLYIDYIPATFLFIYYYYHFNVKIMYKIMKGKGKFKQY